MARCHITQWLEGLREDGVTELVGRARYRRRAEGEHEYHNGYRKPRQLTTWAGTVTARRPQIRGLEERFKRALLLLFTRRTPEVDDVLPELRLHGLALGDFELALRGGHGESTESWKGLLRDARQRGLRCPRVVIGDGHLGIWAALREVYS